MTNLEGCDVLNGDGALVFRASDREAALLDVKQPRYAPQSMAAVHVLLVQDKAAELVRGVHGPAPVYVTVLRLPILASVPLVVPLHTSPRLEYRAHFCMRLLGSGGSTWGPGERPQGNPPVPCPSVPGHARLAPACCSSAHGKLPLCKSLNSVRWMVCLW